MGFFWFCKSDFTTFKVFLQFKNKDNHRINWKKNFLSFWLRSESKISLCEASSFSFPSRPPFLRGSGEDWRGANAKSRMIRQHLRIRVIWPCTYLRLLFRDSVMHVYISDVLNFLQGTVFQIFCLERGNGMDTISRIMFSVATRETMRVLVCL